MSPGITAQTKITTLAINVEDDYYENSNERKLFYILNLVSPTHLSEEAELIDIVVRHGEMTLQELVESSNNEFILDRLIKELNSFITINLEVC